MIILSDIRLIFQKHYVKREQKFGAVSLFKVHIITLKRKTFSMVLPKAFFASIMASKLSKGGFRRKQISIERNFVASIVIE